MPKICSYALRYWTISKRYFEYDVFITKYGTFLIKNTKSYLCTKIYNCKNLRKLEKKNIYSDINLCFEKSNV